jgi:hypothetical protein
MDYKRILSGIAIPDIDEVTTVTNHNLSFYFDDFDEDDFPPDDYESLLFHQAEIRAIAGLEILGSLLHLFHHIEIANVSVKNPTTRLLTRRIVFNDVDVQSNIVENFDPMTIILDVWLNAEEAALEQSYRTLVK